jgi:hypothetical protein
MNQYLVAIIGVLVIVIGALGYIVKYQAGRIENLKQEIGELQVSRDNCIRINEQNAIEFTKLQAAKADAEEQAKAAGEKIKTISSQFRKKLLEITNAKDNGPIPGVLQRTLDGVRDRSASDQDSEGATVDTASPADVPVATPATREAPVESPAAAPEQPAEPSFWDKLW